MGNINKDVYKLQNLYGGLFNEATTITPRVKAGKDIPQNPQQTANITNQVVQQTAADVAALNDTPVSPVDDPDFDELDVRDEGGIRRYEDTDLPEWNRGLTENFLVAGYDVKQPILIFGDPGQGKTSVVNNIAKKVLAPKLSKKYLFWNDLTPEMKGEVIKNPEPYFVSVLIKTADLSLEEVPGIPDIGKAMEKGYIETIKQDWVVFITNPKASGYLFLDEFNRGISLVRAQFMDLTDKRSRNISRRPLANGIGIAAAGNMAAKHNLEALDDAVLNRFMAGVLVLNPDEWLEWAEENGIDKRIIAFVKANPEKNFYTKPKEGGDNPFPTPRSMADFSDMFRVILTQKIAAKQPLSKHEISSLAAGFCGAEWGSKFADFIVYMRSFDINAIMNDPQEYASVKQMNRLHALLAYFKDKLRVAARKLVQQQELTPQEKGIMQGLVAVGEHLNTEYFRIFFQGMLKKEFPSTEYFALLNYLADGDYDPKYKTTWLNTILPKIKKVMTAPTK